jgi:hypothetical protein
MRTILAGVAAALTLAPAALADAVYHSSHIALMPVGSAPLRSGFVENIHPNGPNVFAHEEYVLNGAKPNTTYTVTLHISPAPATTCTAAAIPITTATFTTNPAGNGTADAVITPSTVQSAGLANSTIHAYWTISTGGSVSYTTACQTIRLDA